MTNDRALIALDTNSRTTSMNLYYVAISRACHEARVYTNSVKELPAAIARRFDKTTALAIPARTPTAAPRRRYATQWRSRRQAGVAASAVPTAAQAAGERPQAIGLTAASTKSPYPTGMALSCTTTMRANGS
ncbi:hypothetical protein [Xanthomonas citri]|uniref:hypothetical protein n=1 Tax=Xanthomonas citri TaxID=346 RepID=UPI001F3291BF|nr:hypothetical protein [Xanthomonas citri]